MRQGRTDDAIIVFDDILAKHPARLATKILLARAYEQNGEWLRAQELANKILKELPTDDRALAVLANAQTALGKTADALQSYRKLYKVRPDVAQYRLGLARTLLANGRAPEALGLIRELRKNAPAPDENIMLVAFEADALFALSRGEEAVQMAKSAYAAKPEDYRLGLILAGAYARTDRPVSYTHLTLPTN